MKLSYLAPITSLLVLGLLTPACGDDDSSSTDDAVETDDETDDDTDEPTDDETDEDPTDDETDEDPTDEDPTDDETDEDPTDEDPTDDETDEDPTDEDPTDEDPTDEDPTDEDPTDEDPTDEDPTDEDPTDEDPTDDAGPGPGPGPEPDPVDCPEVEDREIVEVGGEIDEDTTWSCDNVYVLTELTYVVGDSTLTIDAGVEVWGDPGSALVITNGSMIDANGQANAPIVFTSSGIPGERAAGDWGGLVLLGDAPINTGDTASVEGIDPTEGGDLSQYGGNDADHNCGSMTYVRVEFAGFEISTDNELNGIGVAGCGSETTLDHVQIHRGQDDGIEFWGGSAQVSHLLVTNASDDSIDWDSGFQGKLQFVAIQQDPADRDTLFESDSNPDDFDAMPRSMPTLYNLTAVGGDGTGLVLRRGTWGKMYNFILTGFSAAVDVRDAASAAGTLEDPIALTLENSIFFDNGADGETHFADETGDADNDGGFDESEFFTSDSRNNQFDVDPELGDVSDLTAPDFVPAAGSPAAEGGATPEDDGFFDTSATYIGAFEPGGDDWTAGWTAFPEN